jgi:hydrogenase/urease accessory protein HupE
MRAAGMLVGTALVLALAVCPTAVAHPLDPALLDLEEGANGTLQVLWKVPNLRVPGSHVEPVLPDGCRPTGTPEAVDDGVSVSMRWAVHCPAGLIGQRVGVDGLGVAGTDALVRVALADGRLFRAVVSPRRPQVTVPERPDWLSVFRDYARMGTEHIWSGIDHLLFVFGLILLVTTTRLLIETITAFTVGHSMTLSLAVLGVAPFPQRPMEVLIALTIFVLAVELARESPAPTLMRRYPWAMAALFGLLHGFGFAGALRQVGLPSGEIGTALCGFNVGVELGQLAFVLSVLALRAVVRPLLTARVPERVSRIPVYAMGSLAAFWCFERAAALWL